MDRNCIFCQRIESQIATPEADTILEFPNSVAYLGRWQFYHGYTVLIAKLHATELSQLNEKVCHEYYDEMCMVARAIELNFQPHKLNYEMLGNQVPHLHWHVFPRYKNDDHVHLPVWLATVEAERNQALAAHLETGPTDRKETIRTLRDTLEKWVKGTD
jgi:diadenosine tetraphosphate (Ap4A) HIT family hydrolase